MAAATPTGSRVSKSRRPPPIDSISTRATPVPFEHSDKGRVQQSSNARKEDVWLSSKASQIVTKAKETPLSLPKKPTVESSIRKNLKCRAPAWRPRQSSTTLPRAAPPPRTFEDRLVYRREDTFEKSSQRSAAVSNATRRDQTSSKTRCLFLPPPFWGRQKKHRAQRGARGEWYHSTKEAP